MGGANLRARIDHVNNAGARRISQARLAGNHICVKKLILSISVCILPRYGESE